MLTIVFGPRGVGKTALLDRMHDDHGWQVVPCQTTRPPRANERFKRSLDTAVFAKREAEMFSVQEYGVHRYGQLSVDIARTIEQGSDNWIIDLVVEALADFKRFNPLLLLLMPGSVEQLASQLESHGRATDAAEAFAKYHDLYLPLLKSGAVDGLPLHPLTNLPGQLARSASMLVELAKVHGAAQPTSRA